MVRHAAAVVCLLVLGTGCEQDGFSLLVDVKTDLVPGVEFVAAVVQIEHAGGSTRESAPALRSEDWLEGLRVAEFGDVAAGPVTGTVALLDGDGRSVAERPLSLTVSGDTGVTIIITRSCVGVSCPGGESACFAGGCVDPGCVSSVPGSCGEARCVANISCGLPSGCRVPTCVAGACLISIDDSICAAGERCDPDRGCVTDSMDAGMPDAGGPCDGSPCPADTGTNDTSTMDVGPGDTGAGDTGAGDTGAGDTGPSDASDGGSACPPSPVLPWPPFACEPATLDCLIDCRSGACPDACLAADPNPNCADCVYRNAVFCIIDDVGCEEEWSCYAACAEPLCADIFNCPAPTECETESGAFNACSSAFMGPCSSVIDCFGP